MIAHHVYLMTPGASPAEIRRFYGEAIGLAEVAKPSSLAHVSVIWFAAGPILLHVGNPPEGFVGGGHTAFATDDVAAARARMMEMGYRIDENVIPMGYPRFYVRDPWGNQFEILPTDLP